MSTDDFGCEQINQRAARAEVKTRARDAHMAILGSELATGQNIGLHLMLRNGLAHFGFWENDLTGATSIEQSTWVRVAFRYKKSIGEMAIFINGQLTSHENGHAPFVGTGNLRIGRACTGLPFNGQIDEVRIWSEARSTDYKDRPLSPGEKVGRYRFMSFYLEGKTDHFNAFFSEVVDPEWLAGNSEEARALRQVDRTRANKTWRVLHRVTYVERPVLAELGADQRTLVTQAVVERRIEEKVEQLMQDNQNLKAENVRIQQKLDQILSLLASQAS